MKNITTFNFENLNKFNKIFVLVSGGIDSTYLFEMINVLFPDKTFAVNCYNPYEQSNTLRIMKKFSNFIQIKSKNEIDYRKVLNQSFSCIPKALELRKKGKYHKKVFQCCRYIKHNAFKKHELFKEDITVVISGIKYGDGRQRQLFLKSLVNGANYSKGVKILNAPTFYHKHKEGQLYCYPFRDYIYREIPKQVIDELKEKYKDLKHSGCSICPVLVVFQDRFKEPIRTKNSVRYYINEEWKK